MDGSDMETIREQFLPDQVKVLFVGESPPSGGTFFYRANSKLYDATKEAFRISVPELCRGPNFLERFKALGCFLDDLCHEPVNHLKLDNPLAKAKRIMLREQGEESLALRIRRHQPRRIVIVMKGIEANVRRATSAADFDRVAGPALPFPSRPAHREQYVDQLSRLLMELRRQGIITRG